MKKTKYLEFYKECLESGQMPIIETNKGPASGLCANFKDDHLLSLFEPRSADDHEWLSKNGFTSGWWASLMASDNPARKSTFTPMRQTIVLFMHEMSK